MVDLCFRGDLGAGERETSRAPCLILDGLLDLVRGLLGLLCLLEEWPGDLLRRRLSTGETEACRFLCEERWEPWRGDGEWRRRFDRSSCRPERRLSTLLLLPRERRWEAVIDDGGGGMSSFFRRSWLLSRSRSASTSLGCFLAWGSGDSFLSLDTDLGWRALPRSAASYS